MPRCFGEADLPDVSATDPVPDLAPGGAGAVRAEARQSQALVSRVIEWHRARWCRYRGPTPAGGRPAPDCGPGPGRAGRCPPPGRVTAPSVPEPSPLPTPRVTRARGVMPSANVVTPPWFSKPVNVGSVAGQGRRRSTSAVTSPTARGPTPLAGGQSEQPDALVRRAVGARETWSRRSGSRRTPPGRRRRRRRGGPTCRRR